MESLFFLSAPPPPGSSFFWAASRAPYTVSTSITTLFLSRGGAGLLACGCVRVFVCAVVACVCVGCELGA